MEEPAYSSGGGGRGAAPKFSGTEKGEPYRLWQQAYQEYAFHQASRGGLKTEKDKYEALGFAFKLSTPAYYAVSKKRAELTKIIDDAVDAAAAADKDTVENTECKKALRTLWAWLDEQYGEPDALVQQRFTEMQRDPRNAEHRTAAAWGACVMGKAEPLRDKDLVTLVQANNVFLRGLDEELRKDLRPFLLENPLNTCNTEKLVQRAEKVEQARASLAVATGKGKSSILDPGMSDASERRLLKQLAAKQGYSLTPAGATAPQPPQPRPPQQGKWCEFHRSRSHNTADCQQAKQAHQQQQQQQVPQANAASIPGKQPYPGRNTDKPQSPLCTLCGGTRHHLESQCWYAHPHLAPSWWKASQPKPAANVSYAAPPQAQMQQLQVTPQPNSPVPQQQQLTHPQAFPVQMQTTATLSPAYQHQQSLDSSQGPGKVVRFASPSPWTADHAAHVVAAPRRAQSPAELQAQIHAKQAELEELLGQQHLPHLRAPPPQTHAHLHTASPQAAQQHLTVPSSWVDPWAADHAAHTAVAAHTHPGPLPHSFGVLPAVPRTDLPPVPVQQQSSALSADLLQTELIRVSAQLANATQALTRVLGQLASQQPDVSNAAAAADASTQPPPCPEPPRAAQATPEQIARQMGEHNSFDKALWYLHSGLQEQGLVLLDDVNRKHDVHNAMIDTGANCIIFSAEYCKAHNLRFVESSQPLSGAMGQGKAAGHLLTPVTLVLCKGTPHEVSMTVGGKRGVTALVSEGTGHVYDILLGTPFLHLVGACVDMCSHEFVFRPRLQAAGDRTTTHAVPLRPHAVFSSASAAHIATDNGLPHTYIACMAVSAAAPTQRKHRPRQVSKGARYCRLLAAVLLGCLSIVGAVDRSGPPELHTLHSSSRARSSSTLAATHLPSPTHMVRTSMPAGLEAIISEPQYTTDPDLLVTWGNHPETSPAQRKQLYDAVAECREAFAYSVKDLPGYSGGVGPFRIELEGDGDIIESPRRYSKAERQIIDEKCGELLDAGLIQPQLLTRYASCPVVVAKKDADGNWTDARFCVDERRINSRTLADKYTMPLPDQIFQDVSTCKYFTKIDLRAGFHQIPIAQEDQEKTTFWWGNKPFSYTRLCFGLRNATAHFCRVMDHEIRRAGLVGHAAAFVDDVIIYSETFAEHVQHVTGMLRTLHEVGLRAHPEKSVFCASAIEFLGHVVSNYGLSPHEAKVSAIRALPEPKNVPELQSVLGFMNYYRCYVPNYSDIARPLTALTSKNKPWQWTDQQIQSYAHLKAELCAEGRALRRARDDLPFLLYTDWSKNGIGAVLAQRHEDGNEYMVACISRSLNKHEANYSSYEGEMLAAVWAVKTLRPYLHGTPFTLITDHQPLAYIMKTPNLTGKHARWALSLEDYEFTVVHRPGSAHANADVPSRFPRGSAFDGTGARLDGNPSDPPAAAPATPLAAMTALLAQTAEPVCYQEPSLFSLHVCALADSHRDVLLAGNSYSDEMDSPPDLTALTETAQQLRSAALTCVARATTPMAAAPTAAPASSSTICTNPVDTAYYDAVNNTGVAVIELCGGICAGLEMVLRNGQRVSGYWYADSEPRARIAAKYRVAELSKRYPELLSPAATADMFQLQQDIADITAERLDECIPDTAPLLVVAGWPCQDLSPAGTGKGLHGPRSGLFFHVERILSTLQRQHGTARVAYLLENAAMQHSFKHVQQARAAYGELHQHLGLPVCVDAARFGAFAHRLRNYWTNLAPPQQLQAAADCWHRAPGLKVDSILTGNRTSQPVTRDDKPPYYPANTDGNPRSALPTIVAYASSYAFRDKGPGMVYDPQLHRLDEPTALERERALGYTDNTTAATGLTEGDRRELLGNCMDQTTLQSLYALARAVTLIAPTLPSPEPLPAHCMLGGDTSPSAATVAAVAAAQATDSMQLHRDIWLDKHTMHYLHHGTHAEDLSPTERKRVAKRAASYLKIGNTLTRVFKDGTRRTVPKPEDRQAILQQAHNNTGHFGARRTASLLSNSYWWYGLSADAASFVAQCQLCDKVRSSFDAPSLELHPLPIGGLFYRWGVDLCGPFPRTATGNEYIMVCIEHFSKHLLLIPIPSKEPKYTAAAFLAQVLGKFGSCAEVVTDGGGEFQGEFDTLLRDALIDHRTTRANNPQADGLAERAVQTTKNALRKHVEQSRNPTSWEEALPWIALGYNASKQKATGYAPYYLLHGVNPVIPPAVRERMLMRLDFDHPALAADQLIARAEAMHQAGILAAGNLRIAQHRDTLRYAAIRSGSYHPRLRRYEVGDYVYVRSGEPNSTLDTSHFSRILRVARITASGNLVVEGPCGTQATVSVINCSPCHLPNIDTTPLQLPARPPAHLPCEICRQPDRENLMVLCDHCNTGWHTTCMGIPSVPSDPVWVCPRCTESGISADQVAPMPDAQPPERRSSLFPAAGTKRRDAAAQQLDGARVRLSNGVEGVARFVAANRRPRYFDIELPDGSVLTEQTATFVRNRLVRQPVAANTAAAATSLPSHWNLCTAPTLHDALQQLMPGTWSPAHMTRLAREINSCQQDPACAPQTVTAPAEVEALRAFLDFSQLGLVLDPWAGSGCIQAVLKKECNPVLSNDLNPNTHTQLHQDALQPAFYRNVQRHHTVDAIVTSPWFSVLDLALPLAIAHARAVACVHVPGYYITDAHPNRAAFLRTLMQENRLHVLWNLPKGPSGRRCGWLIIFAHAALRERLVQPRARLSAPFSFATS